MNCIYHIYTFTDGQFALLFRGEGQDVEFIEDVMGRLSQTQRKRTFLRGVDPAPRGNPVLRGSAALLA